MIGAVRDLFGMIMNDPIRHCFSIPFPPYKETAPTSRDQQKSPSHFISGPQMNSSVAVTLHDFIHQP